MEMYLKISGQVKIQGNTVNKTGQIKDSRPLMLLVQHGVKFPLTLSQTTDFRLFQSKRVCRRQF